MTSDEKKFITRDAFFKEIENFDKRIIENRELLKREMTKFSEIEKYVQLCVNEQLSELRYNVQNSHSKIANKIFYLDSRLKKGFEILSKKMKKGNK